MMASQADVVPLRRRYIDEMWQSKEFCVVILYYCPMEFCSLSMFPKFRCWRLNPQIHIPIILRDGALDRKLGSDEGMNMEPL